MSVRKPKLPVINFSEKSDGEYRFYVRFESASGWWLLDKPMNLTRHMAKGFLKQLQKQVKGTAIQVRAERRSVSTWEPLK